LVHTVGTFGPRCWLDRLFLDGTIEVIGSKLLGDEGQIDRRGDPVGFVIIDIIKEYAWYGKGFEYLVDRGEVGDFGNIVLFLID